MIVMKLSKFDWLLTGFGLLGALFLTEFGAWVPALIVIVLMLGAVSIDKKLLF